jgi:hypothetical protein
MKHTHTHTGQLRVRGWSLHGLSDCQKKEGQKVENISQKGIQAVVANSRIVADIVQLYYCHTWAVR